MISHRRAEVQYPWRHPKWGRIYVRCGGVQDDSYKEGIRLRGYHQNITDTIRAEQESDAVIRTLSERYKGIYLCNIETAVSYTHLDVYKRQIQAWMASK